MPMNDNAFIPENALPPRAERELFRDARDLVIKHWSEDPANGRARSAAWSGGHGRAVALEKTRKHAGWQNEPTTVA